MELDRMSGQCFKAQKKARASVKNLQPVWVVKGHRELELSDFISPRHFPALVRKLMCPVNRKETKMKRQNILIEKAVLMGQVIKARDRRGTAYQMHKERAGPAAQTGGRGGVAFPGLSQGHISLLLRELLPRDLIRSPKEDMGLQQDELGAPTRVDAPSPNMSQVQDICPSPR